MIINGYPVWAPWFAAFRVPAPKSCSSDSKPLKHYQASDLKLRLSLALHFLRWFKCQIAKIVNSIRRTYFTPLLYASFPRWILFSFIRFLFVLILNSFFPCHLLLFFNAREEGISIHNSTEYAFNKFILYIYVNIEKTKRNNNKNAYIFTPINPIIRNCNEKVVHWMCMHFYRK